MSRDRFQFSVQRYTPDGRWLSIYHADYFHIAMNLIKPLCASTDRLRIVDARGMVHWANHYEASTKIEEY